MAAAAVGLVLLMWMARDPMRRVIWSIFFATGRMFGRWGFWLGEHGKAARLATAEKVAAHREEELQARLMVLESRLGRRAEQLPAETRPIILKMDKSADALEASAAQLAGVSVDEVANGAMRRSVMQIDEGRGLGNLEKKTAAAAARGMKEALTAVRPQLTVLKTEAPRVKDAATRLGVIEQRFNQGVATANETFKQYEECLRSSDRIRVAGKQSILIPWFIALLVTLIAVSGVFLNFFLIQRPMAEIVGEGSRVAGLSLPTFAAMIVIFLEFVAGVILMDAAGFTRLIPTFNGMSDNSRRIMFWVAFLFLAAFSFLEASLAIVREQIIEAELATRQLAAGFLAGDAATAAKAAAAAPEATAGAGTPSGKHGLSLITIAQIVLAVLIPWMLATAALPLETLVRNTVFIAHYIGAFALMASAFVFKSIAAALRSVGLFVLAVYDLVIFAPLWAERRVKGAVGGDAGAPPKQSEERAEKKRRDAEARAAAKADAKADAKQNRDGESRSQEAA